MDTKTKLSDKLDNMIGNFAEGNMPDHAFLTALRECVTEAERLEASPPTLNIGMEAQRTKDRALIQTLVTALSATLDLDNGCPLPTWQKGYDEMCDMRSDALDAAKENGFTPTEE